MPARWARFARGGAPAWGEVRDGLVHPVAEAPWRSRRPLGGPPLPLEGLELLAPCEPTKIVCVGLNYRDHAVEFGHPVPAEPLLFLKALSSLWHPGRPIALPPASGRVEHEAELALVVGRRVPMGGDPAGALFGACCANDVTARDLQRRDGQWARAKSFDTFCPVGPLLVEGVPLDDLAVVCRVNGAVRQASRTRELIFKPGALLAAAAACMTLEPGDILLTGTPSGTGALAPGDVVEVDIEGLGTLSNGVAAFAGA